MILACGIPTEPSLKLVIERLQARDQAVAVFNQRDFAASSIDFSIERGRLGGHLNLKGQTYDLESFRGIFTRLMDYRQLPELAGSSEASNLMRHCRGLHSGLMHWFEVSPARVLNRTEEIGVSYSKPLQSQWINQHGFLTPATLVTNDPERVEQFRREYGQVIYKSMSYIRSIVRLLDDESAGRLSALRVCPVQFQEFIPGSNLRVHTVGDLAFGTSIKADTVDYRYAYKNGESEVIEPVTLDADLTRRCVSLGRAFGLEFAGIDFRVSPDGDLYCLEVNAAPAFSYYELHTGQPIADAVAEHLAAA